MSASLLSTITSPADFRNFSLAQLHDLVKELRAEIIQVVAKREGHLGASLGVVELTVALHTVFNTPEDLLVWDVGHQAYGHKMLTGRLQAFAALRQLNGLSGFPNRAESPYDPFGTGHAATSLSAVLGMALAAQSKADNERQHIAVIGDASIASGMAFEALNHLGTTSANVLIILNDNTMGIDPSVGALKTFFEQIKPQHTDANNLFKALNIAYSGPVDGHDLPTLLTNLTTLKKSKGPRLLHLRTLKGKGWLPAEQDQIKYHAPGKFDPLTGKLNKAPQLGKTKFQTVLGRTLEALFAKQPQLRCITPAMPTGSGLVDLMQAYPERCYDVGIAEQHAVTLAAGMATQGLLPFCVIYSTFLQRAYDQLIHDVALQQLPVIFCVDRAGLVGHDGPTHHGVFDIAFLRAVPHLTVLSPRDEIQLRQQLYQLATHPPQGPVALRYPRGYGQLTDWEVPFAPTDLRRGHCFSGDGELAVISVGTMASEVQAAIALLGAKAQIAHYDLVSIKPLDEKMLTQIMTRYSTVITVEEGVLMGGAGSAVLEWASAQGHRTPIVRLGLPDKFIPHGAPERLKAQWGLDAKGLAQRLTTYLSPSL